jgi:hypothetical protein
MSRLDWRLILDRARAIVASYTTAVTLRQLHYRLVSTPELGYPNTTAAYKRLSELTAKARREGTFPVLTDLTRSIEVPLSFESLFEALAWLADLYRRDRSNGQRIAPMILAEKATLVAQLRDWFGDPLGVPIAALRGYSSESYEREIRSHLETGIEAAYAYTALYLGDFDPSGEDIERNTRRYLGDCFESWKRIAVTPAQIKRYKLPENPGKTRDSRAPGFAARHGRLVQVEIEALDPNLLRRLLTNEINASRDTSTFEAVLSRERAERDLLLGLAETQR